MAKKWKGLMDEDKDEVTRDAAPWALEMANDMICDVRSIIVPYHNAKGRSWEEFTLQIWVGIHIKDIT